jgi:AcrR family transcriptional regulator
MTAEPLRDDTSLRAGVRSVVKARLLDATADVFADDGWSRVTMSKVADRAGLSRQTVYNEFGTKSNLAEELVFRELDDFLELVRSRIEAATDPVEAIGSAVEGALSLALVNPLLKAVLDSAHIGDSDLLPFITQSEALIDRARNAVAGAIRERFPDLPVSDQQVGIAADALVRLVLSHVTQPARVPAEVALEMAWMVGEILRGARD